MVLLLNPILGAYDAARRVAADAVHDDDEVTMDEKDDHWVIEFVPKGDSLGGGAHVVVSKSDFRVIKVVLGQ